MAIIRLNQVQPGLEPKEMSARYQAGLDMAAYADANGFAAISLEEHHGAEDGWSPSPLVFAGMVLSRCPRIMVSISALLVPLHDPLRIAEDIAVIDLASGGRLVVFLGLGYRPEEYAAHGKDFSKRGQLMDEALDAMLKAWTGEPFEYRGTTVRVTPKPLTQPHPVVMVGGSAKVSARRAARFGLPFAPPDHLPELEAYYHELCAAEGKQGYVQMPGSDTVMLHVAEDPEEAWATYGKHMLHEATTYHSWQTPDITSAVHSHASTVEELRKEGIYQIHTPEEVVAMGQAGTQHFCLHPLVGGMPIDEGWRSVHLFTEQVLPKLQ